MENNLSILLNDQVIQIAAAAPLSGRTAALGKEVVQAVELAVEAQNQAGGILGASVRLITADDEGQVQKGESVAREFIGQPGLMGIVGHYNSDMTLAAADIYRQQGLAIIVPVASNPIITESGFRNVFRLTNRDDRTGAALADYLHTEKYKRKAVMIQSNTPYGASMTKCFAAPFTAAGGSIVFREPIPEGYQDFASLVRQFPADHDLLFYGGCYEGAGLLQAYRQAGRTQLFAAGDGCWDVANFLEPVGREGETGEGVLVLSATPEIGQVPGSESFRERYEQHYGKIVNYAVNSYDAARLLLAAVKNAALAANRLPTSTEVAAAVRDIRFRGICYPHEVEWDEKGDDLAAVTALHVIKDGRYRQIAEIPQQVDVLRDL